MSDLNEEVKVPVSGYIALIFAIVFFSGIVPTLASATGQGWLRAIDFNALVGTFGTVANAVNFNAETVTRTTFVGAGGTGARQGFMFAISLLPAVMLALGAVELADRYGALKAAQKLLTPLLRPLMGISGATGLALISSLQSTDAGASMTKALKENKMITENEKTIFITFQNTAGAVITNFFASGIAIFILVQEEFPLIVVAALTVMFVFKIFAANIMRLYVKKFGEEG